MATLRWHAWLGSLPHSAGVSQSSRLSIADRTLAQLHDFLEDGELLKREGDWVTEGTGAAYWREDWRSACEMRSPAAATRPVGV